MDIATGSSHILAVTDLEVSRRYYVETLGFAETHKVDGWAFLSLGNFHVRLGHCPDITPISQAQDHSWFAYVTVTDARSLYADYVRRGVTLWYPLADRPWGSREFAIITPDQHRIVFGQALNTQGDA